jgi:hypothetical protein
MTLQTNLKMIKLLLDDIRLGAKLNSNDTKALRYIISNVYNAVLHKRLGIDKDIESPDFAYMSESFKQTWESNGSPAGCSALKQFGIHEHRTPLNVIIRGMVAECTDEQSIYDFLNEHDCLVFVTKEEDAKLNKAGYRDKHPSPDLDRYDAVGIVVHEFPIAYKNLAKYRNKG